MPVPESHRRPEHLEYLSLVHLIRAVTVIDDDDVRISLKQAVRAGEARDPEAGDGDPHTPPRPLTRLRKPVHSRTHSA